MNKLLILTSSTKSELNSLRNNEFILELMITDIFGCRDKVEVRNDVIQYLNNGQNYFAKFEKFLPHSITYQVL